MIEYIQDRDIWTLQLPKINEFSAWFYTLAFDFEVYDIYTDDDLLLKMIDTKGKLFLELNNYYTEQAVERCVIEKNIIGNKLYFVAYVNSTVCKSDIGNRIIEKYPHVDISVIYSFDSVRNRTLFSLVSKTVDVGEIAFQFGGGGHKFASGVQIKGIQSRIPGFYSSESV